MLAFARNHPLAVQWMDRPFDELVARHVSDPQAKRLLTALTGYVSDGTERLTCARWSRCSAIIFDGGFYPVGGSERLAQVLVEAIEARGGTVRLKTRVERILIADGRAVGVALATAGASQRVQSSRTPTVKRTFLELVAMTPAARFAIASPPRRRGPSAFMVHLGRRLCPTAGRRCTRRPAYRRRSADQVDPSAAPAGHSTVGSLGC